MESSNRYLSISAEQLWNPAAPDCNLSRYAKKASAKAISKAGQKPIFQSDSNPPDLAHNCALQFLESLFRVHCVIPH
ncbi:MAG TPA: hypothetical protein VEG65_08020, partial [Candidatus Bathyarchaeia archaeon]|nr:hypothetical protein [Candidatus Bathyarchaeia archaeon]